MLGTEATRRIHIATALCNAAYTAETLNNIFFLASP